MFQRLGNIGMFLADLKRYIDTTVARVGEQFVWCSLPVVVSCLDVGECDIFIAVPYVFATFSVTTLEGNQTSHP